MEIPSPWLIFAILVHGILGSSTDILSLMVSRLTTPLGHFFNESISLHYDIDLNEAGISQVISIMGSIPLLASIISTILLLPKMDNWGRKHVSIYFSGLVSIVASILVVMSKYVVSLELFAVAKFLIGAVNPFRHAVVKLYIAECSPNNIRGFVSQSISALNTLMSLTTFLLSLEQVFGTDDRWPMIGVISLFMCILFTIAGSFIPESPKYLSYKDAPKEKVINIIKTFHGKDADVEEILTDYSCEFHSTKSSHSSFRELWSDLALRDSIFLIFIAGMIHSFSSIQIIVLNNIPLKIRYGFSNSDALLLDTVLAFFGLPFTLLLPYLLEKIGRRKLFLLSVSLNVICCFLMLLTQILFYIMGPGTVTMILSVSFSLANIGAVSLGASFIGIILIADLLPATAKAVTTQALLLSTSVVSIGVNFGFATFEPIFGAFIYLPFITAQMFFFYYLYRNLPETRGLAVYRNFEQIRSRQNSCRHSLIEGKSRDGSFLNYGTV